MIDREHLEKVIDLVDPRWADLETFEKVYYVHRNAEIEEHKRRQIENTTATVGRVLLYIAKLEDVMRAAEWLSSRLHTDGGVLPAEIVSVDEALSALEVKQ